jgi:hypothetical protein
MPHSACLRANVNGDAAAESPRLPLTPVTCVCPCALARYLSKAVSFPDATLCPPTRPGVILGGTVLVNDENYEWKPLSSTLPTYGDFGSGLDEENAFKHFGGLSLERAYERFLKSPEVYQEDFMDMGPVAFTFYFPIVERYLYTIKAQRRYYDCEAAILATDFLFQLSEPKIFQNKELLFRLIRLTDYVIANLGQYALQGDEQIRIWESWEELRAKLNELIQ